MQKTRYPFSASYAQKLCNTFPPVVQKTVVYINTFSKLCRKLCNYHYHHQYIRNYHYVLHQHSVNELPMSGEMYLQWSFIAGFAFFCLCMFVSHYFIYVFFLQCSLELRCIVAAAVQCSSKFKPIQFNTVMHCMRGKTLVLFYVCVVNSLCGYR